jgi:general secretion pathway protein G
VIAEAEAGSAMQHENGEARSRERRSGFTLLEMMVVLAILGLLAGILFPTAELYLDSRMIESTREEMRRVGDAILRYYQDVGSFPATLQDLEVKPAGAAGWSGPYVRAAFQNETANQDDYRYDAWRSAYLYLSQSATVRRLRSIGPNRSDNNGTGDDIDLDVDASPVLREITRQEMLEINIAISNYNLTHLPSQPLPASFAALLSTLQSQGYLPSDGASTARYSTDGWGQAYVPGPSPVQEVSSAGAP